MLHRSNLTSTSQSPLKSQVFEDFGCTSLSPLRVASTVSPPWLVFASNCLQLSNPRIGRSWAQRSFSDFLQSTPVAGPLMVFSVAGTLHTEGPAPPVFQHVVLKDPITSSSSFTPPAAPSEAGGGAHGFAAERAAER